MDHLYSFMLFAQDNLGAAPAAGGSGAAAGAGAAAGGQPAACGGGTQLAFMLGMLVLFYFLLIRPQQKRAKTHKEMVTSLKRGDSVITSSGIYGRIDSIDGNVVTLEVGKNMRIRILRGYVGGIANTDTEAQMASGPQQT